MNQYARANERHQISYRVLFNRLADIYAKCGRIPESEETYPQGLYNGATRIQWSREWEYPWAIIESKVVPGINVVDLGCGASPLPIFLAEEGCKVIGIDNSSYDDYKEHNEKRLWGFHKLSDKVDYRDENIIKTSIKDEWAHLIFCIGVLEHMKPEEVEPLKKEMHRILVKGGYLVMTADFQIEEIITPERLQFPGFKLVGDTSFKRNDILNLGCDVFGWIQKKVE